MVVVVSGRMPRRLQAFVLLLWPRVTLRGQAQPLIRIVALYTPPRRIFSPTTIHDLDTREVFQANLARFRVFAVAHP